MLALLAAICAPEVSAKAKSSLYGAVSGEAAEFSEFGSQLSGQSMTGGCATSGPDKNIVLVSAAATPFRAESPAVLPPWHNDVPKARVEIGFRATGPPA